jgi:hypothetical protein
MTITQMAEKLATTRGAVSGLVSRAKAVGDPRFVRRPPAVAPAPPAPSPPKPVPPPPVAPPIAPPVVSAPIAPAPPAPPTAAEPVAPLAATDTNLGVTLLDLPPGGCRYAVAEIKGMHRFCGKPAANGRPYCTEHAERTSHPVPLGMRRKAD